MTRILNLLTGLMASAAGIAFLVFSALSLPLCVVALMHIHSFSLMGALAAALVMGAIPIIGWIAYIIYAGIGGYYLVQSGFSWEKASAHQMSQTEFLEFKETALPELVKMCASLSSSVPAGVSLERFCDCYVRAMLADATIESFQTRQPFKSQDSLTTLRKQNVCLMTSREN